jgi:hypothetical protein
LDVLSSHQRLAFFFAFDEKVEDGEVSVKKLTNQVGGTRNKEKVNMMLHVTLSPHSNLASGSVQAYCESNSLVTFWKFLSAGKIFTCELLPYNLVFSFKAIEFENGVLFQEIFQC